MEFKIAVSSDGAYQNEIQKIPQWFIDKYFVTSKELVFDEQFDEDLGTIVPLVPPITISQAYMNLSIELVDEMINEPLIRCVNFMPDYVRIVLEETSED